MGIIGIIILLFLALIILIILQHTDVVISNTTKPNYDSFSNTELTGEQPSCAETHFGCCPDGVNSKANLFGSNCP